VDGTKRKIDIEPFKNGFIYGQSPDPLSPNKYRTLFPKGNLLKTSIEVAFVSTNSITQGEQVAA